MPGAIVPSGPRPPSKGASIHYVSRLRENYNIERYSQGSFQNNSYDYTLHVMQRNYESGCNVLQYNVTYHATEQ
jgi:hypothetical protein